MFFCTAGGIDGKGLYTSEGFVVLKGSKGKKAISGALPASDRRFRERLIETGVMKEQADTVVFLKDHLFNSPSYAGVALLGRSSNGWKEWKNKDGVTLDKLKRAAQED